MKKGIILVIMLFFLLNINVYAKTTSTSKVALLEETTTVLTDDGKNVFTDELTKIKVEVKANAESNLKVIEVNEDDEIFKKLKTDNANLIGAYNISIEGTYEGKISITFPVSEELTGRNIRFTWLNDEDELVTRERVAFDGEVSIDVDDLNTFMLTYDDYESITGTKASKFKKNTNLFIFNIVFVIVAFVLSIIVIIKKRNSN